jgi:hypothetical protein
VSYFPHEADLKLANRVASGDRVDPGDCLRHDLQVFDTRQNDVGLAVGKSHGCKAMELHK